MRTKFTPEMITSLEDIGDKGIFVFGSNIQGEHCGGAALVAATKFNAIEGQGFGLQGSSYAIPTCIRLTIEKYDEALRCTKPFDNIEQIKPYIISFINDAKHNSDLTFYVTKIGCGIAGFNIEEIAELFRPCLDMENVILPKEFVNYLDYEDTNGSNKSIAHQVERVITAADRGYTTEIVFQLRKLEKDYCISLNKEIEWLQNMVNLNEFKVGERVLFHCFDKSTIEVTVTEVNSNLVYGVSDKGTSHWANKKDVTKLK